MRQLLKEKLVDEVIGRPELPEEIGSPISYPESHNLRLGLTHCQASPFVICQAADVAVLPGTYKLIKDRIEEHEAVVFHWENGAGCQAYHTNLFAVRTSRCWPPLLGRIHEATLEVLWAQELGGKHVYRWHNSRSQRFVSEHSSEHEAALPLEDNSLTAALPLHIRGHKSIWRRLMEYLRLRDL